MIGRGRLCVAAPGLFYGMHATRLHHALQKLSEAILEVENELAAMKADHDPLASHIFISRRHYRNADDTKSGKRREINARLSFNAVGCHKRRSDPMSRQAAKRLSPTASQPKQK
jgi:hypothetical protein